MTTLIDLLYQYAQEHRMAAALSAAGPEFHTACRLAEQEQGELEGLLEGLLEGRAAGLFSRYLDHRTQADLEEHLALFRCGLALGQELGRL